MKSQNLALNDRLDSVYRRCEQNNSSRSTSYHFDLSVLPFLLKAICQFSMRWRFPILKRVSMVQEGLTFESVIKITSLD